MTYMTTDKHLYLVYVFVLIALTLGALATYRTYNSVDTSKDHVKSYERTIRVTDTNKVDTPAGAGKSFGTIGNLDIGPVPVGTIILSHSYTVTNNNSPGSGDLGTATVSYELGFDKKGVAKNVGLGILTETGSPTGALSPGDTVTYTTDTNPRTDIQIVDEATVKADKNYLQLACGTTTAALHAGTVVTVRVTLAAPADLP